MRLSIAAIAAIAVGAASAANSQEAPPPAPPQIVVPARPEMVPSMAWRAQAMDRFHSDAILRQRAEAEERRQAPERRARAERLAALANSGHCDEAVTVARAEGDQDMATRLVAACTAAN